MAEAALLVLVAAAAGAVARAAPPVPDAGLLALQLGAGAGPGAAAGSGAHEAEDAPLESQQGILLHDRPAWGLEQEGGPNEPLGAMKSAAWARPLDLPVPLPPPPPALAGAEGMAGVGVGVGMGARATMRRLPRYRARKGPPLDRRRKLKVLRRQDPMAASRALADQPDVYVVDETVTGYAPEAGEGGPGALAPLLPPLPPLAPLHVAPDAALLAGAWLDDDDALHVRHRLQKLDFYFQLLRILSEDCRQRVLCEVAREPERFSPLAAVLGEVTSFSGSYQYVTSHLINTTEGARLLSYMEASFRGQDRARSCAVFQYRCPSRTEDMINYDALCLWREMVRWLTIHVVARPP
ncbi:hypothetical protein R5R35_001021 [Gryllus longicercus]|uniref:Uncharacterized protein n=1 Tax=Gryllus longicercus TaxID=2509291 RepID=A0AAN9UZY7_9ORTH